jgi:hypothetical protein
VAQFAQMVDVISEGHVGAARVEHYEVSLGDSRPGRPARDTTQGVSDP